MDEIVVRGTPGTMVLARDIKKMNEIISQLSLELATHKIAQEQLKLRLSILEEKFADYQKKGIL